MSHTLVVEGWQLVSIDARDGPQVAIATCERCIMRDFLASSHRCGVCIAGLANPRSVLHSSWAPPAAPAPVTGAGCNPPVDGCVDAPAAGRAVAHISQKSWPGGFTVVHVGQDHFAAGTATPPTSGRRLGFRHTEHTAANGVLMVVHISHAQSASAMVACGSGLRTSAFSHLPSTYCGR